jgi:hypothetical protein
MTIRLDGVSLTRAQLLRVARGEGIELDEAALPRVARAADFLAAQVAREEPIYGVSTGFGSNADKLLGAHPLRDELPGASASGQSPHIELQRNLIVTHAVCVGEPFAPEVVRAMLCIRINTLLRGHSGIRVQTLQALAAMRGSCRWCRSSARSARRATSRRCRTWPSSCSVAARPSSMANALPVPRPCDARGCSRSRCPTRKGWR